MTPLRRITGDKPEVTIQLVFLSSQLQLGDLQRSLEQVVHKTTPPVLTFLSYARFIGAVLKQNFITRSLHSVSLWLQEGLLSFRINCSSPRTRRFCHSHGKVIFILFIQVSPPIKSTYSKHISTLNRTKYLKVEVHPYNSEVKVTVTSMKSLE